MNYITIIKEEITYSWKIGFNETNNLKEHQNFKKEMLKCANIISVKILKVEEIN